MHFSVPDTQELVDESGNSYLGYNIHINGVFHCTVRYKQLHSLHEQLFKDLEVDGLPSFPPKKFFPLTTNQAEDRRVMLDKYIQAIGQNSCISSSDLLNGFLLNAQLESARDLSTDDVSIFLMNGKRVEIRDAKGTESSGQLLYKALKELNLDESYHLYFTLFIGIQNEENFMLFRKLQNFESPIVTQNNMKKFGSTKIILGKWFWDISKDIEISGNPICEDLLFIQAAAEVERNWIIASKEIRKQLKFLQDNNKKSEYLQKVRSLRNYGSIQFVPCTCDYPESGSKVIVSIGRNELSIKVITPEKGYQELIFKVTRMRCWRITTLNEGVEKTEESQECSLELSFEYLMAKDQLQWVTISSEQAILMSICLQSMIDELLVKNLGENNGQQKKKEATGKSFTYVNRNGQSQILTNILPYSSDNIKNNSEETDHRNSSPKTTSTEPIIKKFTERFLIRKNKKANNLINPSAVIQENRRIADGDFLENNAFCMIGDDDL